MIPIEQLIDEFKGNELVSQTLFPLLNRLLNDRGYQCVFRDVLDYKGVFLKSIKPCDKPVDDKPKDKQHQKAIEPVGADAEPTGRLRIMRSPIHHAMYGVYNDELQQEWVSGTDDQTKTVWLPVPIINT